MNIEKINSYFGYSFIKNISIKTINIRYANLKKKNLIEKNKINFESHLEKIKDLNLKNKLENLINAFNKKK